MNKENGALLSYIALLLKDLNEPEPNLFALRQLLTNFYPLLNINELARQGIKPLGERVKNLVPQDVASEPFRQELRQFLTEVEFFLNGTPQAQVAANTITPETLEALVKAQEERAMRIKTAETTWKTKWEQLIKEYNGRLDRLFIEKLPELAPQKRIEAMYRISEAVRKNERQAKLKNEPAKNDFVEVLRQNIMTELGLPANASPQLAAVILQGHIQAQALALIPLENEITEASQLAALLQVGGQSFGITGDALVGSFAAALTDIRRGQGEQSLLPNSTKAAETLAQLKNVALLATGVELPPLALAGVLDWAYRVMPVRKFFRLPPAPAEIIEKAVTQPATPKRGVIQLSAGPLSFFGRFVSEFVNRSGLSGIWRFLFSSGQAVFQRINLGSVLSTGINNLFSGAGRLLSGTIAVNRQRALLGIAVSPATRSAVLITIAVIAIVFFVFNPLENVHLVDSAALLPQNEPIAAEGEGQETLPGNRDYIDPVACNSLANEVCCVPKAGYCSLNNPSTRLTERFGDQARNAAQVCWNESIHGIANVINDACLPCNPVTLPDGSCECSGRTWVKRCDFWSWDYSVGLFQINMLATCSQAFVNGGGSIPSRGTLCVVKDQTALNSCVSQFQNPDYNTNYALGLYEGRGWQPWTNTARKCSLPL